MKLIQLPLPLLLLSLMAACGSQTHETASVEALRAPFRAWPNAPAPAIPGTPAMVALGERLYHETALSKSRDVSCATCHSLETFGQDNLPVSPGTTGLFGKRSAPSSFNAFRQIAQFWDGRADSVETQSTMPMLTDVEHGLVSEQEIVEKLKAEEGYEEAFRQAFPESVGDPIQADHVRAAIGAFERTLITVSPFDRWVEGDDDALTADQLAGLEEFVSVGCTICHSSRAVGGQMYQKLGLIKPVESADLGRYEATGKESDKYFFKVPSLLNVAKTAPYLHDGSQKTLEETIRFMADVQLGKTLSDSQVASIATFLEALTGERVQPASPDSGVSPQ